MKSQYAEMKRVERGTIELLDLACIFGSLFPESPASLGRDEMGMEDEEDGYLLAVVEALLLLALLSPVASSLRPCLLALVEAGEIETRWN